MLRDSKTKMKSKGYKHAVFISFAFFLQTIFITSLSAKESVSVGVVNVTFLMENSPQSEIASENLKTKFSPQEKTLAAELDEINALELELSEIKIAKSDLDKQRKIERQLRTKKRVRSRALQDFREELRFARDLALDEVQKEVFKAIAEVREQQNIDIILQDYISASKRVDITTAVLDYLRNKADQAGKSNTSKTTNK